MIEKIKLRLWNILASGLPTDFDLETLRKMFLLNFIVLIGCFFLTLLGSIAFIERYFSLAAVDLVLFIFLICLFIYLRKTKNYNVVGMIGSIGFGGFYFFLIASGAGNKAAYIWMFTYPLVVLFLLGKRWGAILSFLLLGLSGIVFIFGEKVAFFTSYKTDLIIRLIPVYIVVFLLAFIMEGVREIVQHRLETSNAELKKTGKEKEALIDKLQKTIKEINILQGILPICANCKKIRNDSGYWEQVEQYVQDRSNAQFSHSICPECAKKLYGEIGIGK
jgi:glucan phosphoethanolaminetransferase (alkaline phosphatase superfamily)